MQAYLTLIRHITLHKPMITQKNISKLPPLLLFSLAASFTTPAHANSYQPDFADHYFSTAKDGTNPIQAGKQQLTFANKISAGVNIEPLPFSRVGEKPAWPSAFHPEQVTLSFANLSGRLSGTQVDLLTLKHPSEAYFAPFIYRKDPAPDVSHPHPHDGIAGSPTDGTVQKVTGVENIPSPANSRNEPTSAVFLTDTVSVPEGSPGTGTLMCYVIIGFALIGRRLLGFQLR